ncbi:MAG: hypothetical protein ACKOBC_12095 [Hyphomicrobiales bacterium]
MAIHLDVSQTKLHFVLQVSYRILAIFWLIKGFWAWADLTGAIGPGLHLVKTALDAELAMALVFAILDLIAGVALWMSWRWGAGVWFLVATAYGLSAIASQSSFAHEMLGVFTLVLVVVHILRIFFVRAQPEKRLTIL